MAGRGFSEMQFLSPLRYPGGKGRLSNFLADVVRLNGLVDGHYAEPYAGGASIAIALLFLELVERVHINDINSAVHAFWQAVLNQTDALCRMIHETPVDMDQWRRQRAVQDDPDAPPLAVAFSTFFLNRANRSGIIRGGVIGGKGQTGNWKIDARYNKAELTRRIQKIAKYGKRIALYNQDASAFLQRTLPKLPDRTLVYLDPPYWVKGKGLYEDHYTPEDHAEIARIVRLIRQSWVVSYDNVPEIRALYAGLRHETFGLHYSAHDRYRGTEVMVFRDGLIVPDEIRPSRGAVA